MQVEDLDDFSNKNNVFGQKNFQQTFQNFGGQFLNKDILGRSETQTTTATTKAGSRNGSPLEGAAPHIMPAVKQNLVNSRASLQTQSTVDTLGYGASLTSQQLLLMQRNGPGGADSTPSSNAPSKPGSAQGGESVGIRMQMNLKHGMSMSPNNKQGSITSQNSTSTYPGTSPAWTAASPTSNAVIPSSFASVQRRFSNADSEKRHHRASSTKNLQLSEHSAPWPTCATSLMSPKHSLPEYSAKLGVLLREFFITADYEAFCDQAWGIRCETYNDVTVAAIFRQGLEQRELPASRGQELYLEGFGTDEASCDSYYKASWEYLLVRLLEQEFITSVELMRGLYGYIANMQDLEKDVPYASERLLDFLDMLVQRELLDSSVYYRLPEDILLRSSADANVSNIAVELKVFKKIMGNALHDYYETRNFGRLEQILKDVSMNLFSHELVKRAILTSLDLSSQYSDEERSMVVVTLLKKLLAKNLLMEEDLQHGLALALGRLEDIAIDVPHCVKYMTNIYSHLVSNEILSAELLKREQNLGYGGAFGAEVCTNTLHNTPEYSRKIWSGAGDESCLLKEMDLAIEEYFDSYDSEEVARIFGELHLSRDCEIRFIRKILLYSVEKRNVWVGLNLVAYLHDILWGTSHIEYAVESLRADSDEIAVDIPDISEALTYLVGQAHRYGLLSDEYVRLDQQFQV